MMKIEWIEIQNQIRLRAHMINIQQHKSEDIYYNDDQRILTKLAAIYETNRFNGQEMVEISIKNYNLFVHECTSFMYGLSIQREAYTVEQQNILSMLGYLITHQIFIQVILSIQIQFIATNIAAVQQLCDQIAFKQIALSQSTFGDLYNLLRICAHINSYNNDVNDSINHQITEIFSSRDPNFAYISQTLNTIQYYIIQNQRVLSYLTDIYYDKIIIQILQIQYIPFMMRYYIFTQFVYNFEKQSYADIMQVFTETSRLDIYDTFFKQFILFSQSGINNFSIEQLPPKHIQYICQFAIEHKNVQVYKIIIDIAEELEIDVTQIFLYLIYYIVHCIAVQISQQQRRHIPKYLQLNSQIQNDHLTMLEIIFKYQELIQFSDRQIFEHLFTIIDNNRCREHIDLEIQILQILAQHGYDLTKHSDFLVFIQQKAQDQYNEQQKYLFNNIIYQVDMQIPQTDIQDCDEENGFNSFI